MREPLCALHGLYAGYRGDRTVLRGVDLALGPDGLTVLLGPNGAGKTTLLRCLLGELSPGAGDLWLDGRPLGAIPPRERARLLAYVPQLPASAFAFTVRELVAMGRFAHQGALGLASAADRAAVDAALVRTGVEGLAGRTLDEISGGEAQRAMIARALAQEPRLLLLDEPTSHLDLRQQLLVFGLLRELSRPGGTAVLCVGHDVNLAARFADRLVLLGEGRVLADGRPAEVLDPALLERCYGVAVELVPAGDGPPLVRAAIAGGGASSAAGGRLDQPPSPGA